MVRTRPRTKLVKKRNARRCKKCGSKLNSQMTRCRRCHSVQNLPTSRVLS
jgi:hypothetical protein